MPASLADADLTHSTREERPGILVSALWIAAAPAFISVCLAGFMVSAAINALTPRPADVPSTDELPV